MRRVDRLLERLDAWSHRGRPPGTPAPWLRGVVCDLWDARVQSSFDGQTFRELRRERRGRKQ